MALEKIIEKAPQEKPVSSEKEKISNPDKKRLFERPRFKVEENSPFPPFKSSRPGASAPLPISAWQKKRAEEIDHILADGLNEIFLQMPKDRQQAFKKKGEETVIQINDLLNKTRVRMEKIIALIRAWLKMIPGVNKFFLEQEAKIKADRIVKLKDKH